MMTMCDQHRSCRGIGTWRVSKKKESWPSGGSILLATCVRKREVKLWRGGLHQVGHTPIPGPLADLEGRLEVLRLGQR